MTTDVAFSAAPNPRTLDHSGPLTNAQAQLAAAVATLGYEEGLHELLSRPRREMTVSIPLRRDDGTVQVLGGHRVKHNVYRCPYGGAKGGIRIEPRNYSRAEFERVTRRYTSEILPIIGPDKDIPAPDVGTDERTMGWMMDTYSVSSGYTVPGVVTGNPVSLGGLLGRSTATSDGVVHIALAALRHIGLRPSTTTAAVQGFGKVGAGAARFLAEAGVTVVAVSDQYGAIHHGSGIDVAALQSHVAVTGSVVGFAGADAMPAAGLLTLDVDLLVPAAVESVLHQDNAADVAAKVIVEGANGPTTGAADRILANRGVLVVPDILANAGGVIVSYFEWVQSNQAYWWSASEVDEKLERRMLAAWNHLLETADARGLTLREAATVTAVERVADAHRIRGLYPRSHRATQGGFPPFIGDRASGFVSNQIGQRERPDATVQRGFYVQFAVRGRRPHCRTATAGRSPGRRLLSRFGRASVHHDAGRSRGARDQG